MSGELNVTNPHWHKSANAWILKNGKKQILQVCSLHDELTVITILMISELKRFTTQRNNIEFHGPIDEFEN